MDVSMCAFMSVALINLVCRAHHVCEDFASMLLAYGFEAPPHMCAFVIDHACRLGYVERRGGFLFAADSARLVYARR